ncbi:histone H2A-beta, sperm-like [Bradysia coprophila]|uniref:histone H2A-beta, sperm-like n=1 Tax=Bradysia coprophila TaxID=38358 RepID=UPI00187DAA37|nr:histone H2A-beta, sperm-like [Bradysia coprophila]
MAEPTQPEVIAFKPKDKRVTQTERAGLTFPVGRINRKLREGKYAKLIGRGSAVYSAAVLEYLVAEVLEMAGNEASDNKRKRINPRHITLAVKNDAELSELLKDVTFSEGGVLPFIHEVLKHRISPLRLSKKSLEMSSQKSTKKSSQKSSHKTSQESRSSPESYKESVEL